MSIRSFISALAKKLAEENDVDGFIGSPCLISNFMKRYNLSLRKVTNLTVLSDQQLVNRAMDYMVYLQARIPHLNLSKTILMDETAIYFEDARTETVDIRGRKHVVLKSTGFASMRITALVSVWANGTKAAPLIIHKGLEGQAIERVSGPLLFIRQEKAWVNERLIIKWIDVMFPIVEITDGKAIVWDSCRAHISNKVKEHCRRRNIELIVIPGGLTPYLQAGDIGIFKELKDKISASINLWKNSDNVEYTARGNPKPPRENVVHAWVIDAWRSVNVQNISRSIQSAGFSPNFEDWHITKHDVYGNMFRDVWINNRGAIEVNAVDLEEIPQDDDIEEIIDDVNTLQIDDVAIV